MALTRFFLFRHDTPDNPDDICYGEDMKVKFSGKAAYRHQLARLPGNLIWMASSLDRTMQTAWVMAQMRIEKSPQPIQVIARMNLREQLFGQWVGIKRSDLVKDPTYHAYRSDPVNIAPPGGENLKDFLSRVRQDFNAIAALHPGENIAVFTHGGVIRAQAAEAIGIDMPEALKLPVDPLSLTIITHNDKKKVQGQNPWTLEAMNLKP